MVDTDELIGTTENLTGLTLEDHVRNYIIREIMDTEVTLTDTVEAKQLKRYGHMKRM
jgi:hypothetical protein